MSDELVLDKVVTNFFLDTYRRQPSKHVAEAAMHCAVTAVEHTFGDNKAEPIALTTGSVAEFSINPMLSCIGDIDVMYYPNNKLVIPAGYSPPTQLPDHFCNYVQVHEIIDSQLPGYVYLKLRYLLTKNSDDEKYNSVQYDRKAYLNNVIGVKSEIYGPAETHPGNAVMKPRDSVLCIRCLLWPTQAADWPTRHRNYGWPDSATICRVISNGCDVVRVAHRQCDEQMKRSQWRLSFSRAEIVLLNSWTPVQQIVYHMLRFFVKAEQLSTIIDMAGSKIFSNYHLKTLMLWACELKPNNWWTNGSNTPSNVRVCVHLLHTLAVWFSDKRCQHYFIHNCNLIDATCDVKEILNKLISVTESRLQTWFINNYIRKCAQLCSSNISRMFDDIGTIRKLQDAVSAVVHWTRNTELQHLWRVSRRAQYIIVQNVSAFSLSVRSCVCWITELSKIDRRLALYFTAVAFLHVSIRLTYSCRTARRCALDYRRLDIIDILATIVGINVVNRTQTQIYSRQQNCQSSLSNASELMKVVANTSRNTLQLIEIEMCKAYLYRALMYKNSDCLVNVYLAVLYYTTGQYETATNHCMLVMRTQRHSQCSSHVIQGALLPKLDDNVDAALGLCIFYDNIRTVALGLMKPTQHVNILTTDMFVRYLYVRCLAVTKCHQMSSDDLLQRYRTYLVDIPEMLTSDVLLSKLTNSFHHKLATSKKRTTDRGDKKAPALVKLLQTSAVEHLTTFRQLETQQFGSAATIITTTFEALYAYKRGDFQQCLQTSAQNTRALLYGDHLPDISIVPEFIELLDDDMVSLIALPLIINPKCRDEFVRNGFRCIIELTLSLYLMIKCQLQLLHPVTSLIQTLNYIEVARRKLSEHPISRTLDQLVLKFSICVTITHIQRLLRNNH